MFKLYMILNHTFLKYVMVFHYICVCVCVCVCDLKFNGLDSLFFAPNNSLTTKIKNLNGHIVKN